MIERIYRNFEKENSETNKERTIDIEKEIQEKKEKIVEKSADEKKIIIQNGEIKDNQNTKMKVPKNIEEKKSLDLNNFGNFFDSFLSPAEILNTRIAKKKG